ncbi:MULTISPECIES: rod shape-determining protein MreC [unclassified Undibacterium]|uniref:rod shape-determining protein MreC n=1 Tax=unclassified Undibacterium TaxID=2630295 RepID=UPI002AC8E777|nr:MULTISPECIES: rod shape-determining protein MreC [unclassified Undibacterium]MEB0139936.1 rod shape-determining protein MreC [Undibacterium sp. CCC2.1]MEB0172909.1 rod shape-determining protein MreC [Undibacterium sp. CCC1.1]MEB0176736.1 rod shape-determining protein MreC [Undibacterium sp. CCC3.4]MEB0216663.1 rod shape-determining protein MreC [Undibacterium sp. 5I2]WPX44975.1 rod shape-determining protein MreC [Undibacterium sp. CCC3.4]
MEYSPPPLFKQGASARARAIFFTILAIFLLVVDSRLKSLMLARQVIGTALYPLQMAAVVPSTAVKNLSHYFVTVAEVEKENIRIKHQQTLNADVLQQTAQLQAENSHLRKLLDARERLTVKSVLAEIIYDARDPSTRKVIVDRGIKDGIALGQPVIDDLGVVGQITRIFPFTAEVTLLTDKNQAIPVQILRNGLRSVAYGRGQSPYLDMRLTSNADVQNGDQLVTSGIDGIYPAGLAVAKVVQVENKAVTTFENILCVPTAGIDRNKQLLILQVSMENLPRPDTEDVRAKKEKLNRKVTRDAAPASSDVKPVDQPSLAETAKEAAEALDTKEPAK